MARFLFVFCSKVYTQTDELNQVVKDLIQDADRGETSLSDIDSPSKRGKKLLNTKYWEKS